MIFFYKYKLAGKVNEVLCIFKLLCCKDIKEYIQIQTQVMLKDAISLRTTYLSPPIHKQTSICKENLKYTIDALTLSHVTS